MLRWFVNLLGKVLRVFKSEDRLMTMMVVVVVVVVVSLEEK